MSLKLCVECGQPVSPGAVQCPKCGLRHPTVRQARPSLPLLSATSPGMPTVRCRECQTELRGRMDVCPVCGARNPVARGFPWRLAAGVLAVAGLAAAAWVSYGHLVRTSARDAGFVSLGPPPPSRVPRVRAYGFTAHCATPAPVYIFEAGTIPEAYIVMLASREADPAKAAKALAAKYQLATRGYEPDKGGFAAGLSSGLVAKLRCEPGVESIQEDPASRFDRRKPDSTP
jgi:RNA polymerase subunit RPABC4/transcription elongation factor Spt4